MGVDIPQEYYDLLPAYVAKMTYGDVFGYSLQKYKPHKDCRGLGCDSCDKGRVYGFFHTKALLTQDEWDWHFWKSPKHGKRESIGSLGLIGRYKDDTLKYIVWDLDEPHLVEKAHQHIIPYLLSVGADPVFEYSGEPGSPRGHLWLMTHCPLVIAQAWVNQILADIGSSVEEFDEIYNVNGKRDAVMRQPLGPHIKRGDTRYPVRWRGQDYHGVLDGMRVFIDAEVFPEERIASLIREDHLYAVQQAQERKDRDWDREDTPYYYVPRRLESPYPLEELPRGMVRPVRNCQAINEMLRRTKEDRLLNKRGATIHDWGFFLSRMAMHSDIMRKRSDGVAFLRRIIQETRQRPFKDHNWDSMLAQVRRAPNRYYPSCDALKRFNLCDGCPFVGIGTPRRFSSGSAVPIEREVLEEVIAKTPEEIRVTTFQEVEDQVDRLMEHGGTGVILLRSPQQAGKSYLGTKLLAKYLSRYHLLLVPTAHLAYEYRDRLRDQYGLDSYILGSQRTLFTGHPRGDNVATFPCPYQADIDYKADLGQTNAVIKAEVCSGCPAQDRCPWLNQYREVRNPHHRIIIAQHAHLGVPEVIKFLAADKQFDQIIIDESFKEHLVDILTPSYNEKVILGGAGYKWSTRLLEWFRTGVPGKDELVPPDCELEQVQQAYKKAKLPWNLPEYLRAHNNKDHYDPVTGLEMVNKLPWGRVRVLLDATPPVELIKMLTGIPEILVYGDGEVIDYRRVHPDNEVIQVLDSTVSKTNLERHELFYEILAKIAYLMRHRFPNGRGLITAYKGWEDKVDEYFQGHPMYRDVRDRVDVGIMERGTNEYQHHAVQFVLASVNFTGKEYYHNRYKHLCAYNWHQRQQGWNEVSNPYPYDIYEQVGEEAKLISAAIEPVPVERLEYREDGKVERVRYPQFNNYPPSQAMFRLDYDNNVSAFQQNNRIRFLPGHWVDPATGVVSVEERPGWQWIPPTPKSVYFLGNLSMRGIVVSRSVTLTQFLNDPRV